MIVKLKYISIGALVIIGVLFYFMNESNKASAERLKQAEIANQQRLQQNKADEEQAKKNLEAQRIQSEETRALKVEEAKKEQLGKIRDSEKQKLEKLDLEARELKKYKEISDKWMAQDSIASSTGRIALSTPVTELRRIRDELNITPITGCLSEAKEKLLSAMDDEIYMFVYFMQNDIQTSKKTTELKISYFNKLTEEITIYTQCKNKYGKNVL